jgi:hypothetical protein
MVPGVDGELRSQVPLVPLFPVRRAGVCRHREKAPDQ